MIRIKSKKTDSFLAWLFVAAASVSAIAQTNQPVSNAVFSHPLSRAGGGESGPPAK